MTDSEIRGRLLVEFHQLRHNNGGWVPVSEMMLSPQSVDLGTLGGVCQQLADVRLIQWKLIPGSNGLAAGMAKITGQGVAAVESGRSADIDIRFPTKNETVQALGDSTSVVDTARPSGLNYSSKDGGDHVPPMSIRAAIAGQDEWIGAAGALALLGKNSSSGARTICKRAHAGLIRARAVRFIRDGKATDNVDIPAEFWWADGNVALQQNWTSGDFDTWIDRRIHLQAFGVKFWRADIEQLRPILVSDVKPPSTSAATAAKTIFVGHGRSNLWRELKDFLQDRLNLTVDEFNRKSTAGVATVARLEDMLKDAAFAFLVMTGEDELPDGRLNARLNVVHEVGLFQGRLGFKKAIVLLEEGCEEFSNIHGLGQIRFPRNAISAKFEEIRAVLEREQVIS